LEKEIQDVLINEIRKKDPVITLHSFAQLYHKEIKHLYDAGILDDTSLEKALEEITISGAKRAYEWVVKGKFYADHVPFVEGLAYALMRDDVFTPKQKINMPLDHGMTLDKYCNTYGSKDFIADMKKEFLNPKKIEFSFSDKRGDPHPACGPHN